MDWGQIHIVITRPQYKDHIGDDPGSRYGETSLHLVPVLLVVIVQAGLANVLLAVVQAAPAAKAPAAVPTAQVRAVQAAA